MIKHKKERGMLPEQEEKPPWKKANFSSILKGSKGRSREIMVGQKVNVVLVHAGEGEKIIRTDQKAEG